MKLTLKHALAAIRIFAALAIFTFVSGCFGNNDLSRDQAALAIAAQTFPDEWKIVKLDLINCGEQRLENVDTVERLVEDYMFGRTQDTQAVARITNFQDLKNTKDLARQGLVKGLKWNNNRLHIQSVILSAVPVLTDDIQSIFESYKRPYQEGDSGSYSVVIAQRHFAGVTGITGEGTVRSVQYKILVEPTAIGKKLEIEPKAEIKYATFVLYDDGWRMELRGQ